MTGVSRKVEVNRPCLLCGRASDDPEQFRLRFPECGYPGEFVLRRCGGCGLLYNSPRLDDDGLAALYDGSYYLFQERPSDAFERIAELHQATVRSLVPLVEERRVLEVGCAKGYLLALLRAQGWAAQGLELSRFAAAHARTAFGLDVFEGTLEAYAAERLDRRFPAVFTTDVIEHVPDPSRFASCLARVTAPGGVLLVGTPNAASEGLRRFGGDWLGFNPFHIWCFSRETLTTLLERAGFEVLQAYTYQNGMPQSRDGSGGPRRWARRLLPGSALRAIRRVRDALRERGGSRAAAPEAGLPGAVAAARSQPLFEATSDGRHPDAPACRGENLVVIARRRG